MRHSTCCTEALVIWCGSNFNVETWSGSQFNAESWHGVIIQRVISDPGQNSTLNCDLNPGSQVNVELWLWVKIQRWTKTWDHISTLNQDPLSQSNGGGVFQILSVEGVVKQWPPVSGGGRNSTWKIRWIMSTARWIRTPSVQIQCGQNSILHRKLNPDRPIHCPARYFYANAAGDSSKAAVKNKILIKIICIYVCTFASTL